MNVDLTNGGIEAMTSTHVDWKLEGSKQCRLDIRIGKIGGEIAYHASDSVHRVSSSSELRA